MVLTAKTILMHPTYFDDQLFTFNDILSSRLLLYHFNTVVLNHVRRIWICDIKYVYLKWLTPQLSHYTIILYPSLQSSRVRANDTKKSLECPTRNLKGIHQDRTGYEKATTMNTSVFPKYLFIDTIHIACPQIWDMAVFEKSKLGCIFYWRKCHVV